MATALVVPVKFKIGSTTYTPTVTHASLVSAFALVNQYYNEISYGSFPGWTVTVYPSGSSPLNIPGTILASDLTSAGLKNAADPLVSGFTPSSFDVVVYIVAQGVEGLWGHQGWTVAVPGQRCYVSESDFVAAPDGHVRPSVTCHELGHAQGLNHCHGWHCNSTAAFCQPAADILQYVGGDLMGDAGPIYTSHPNVFEKWQLGYLTLGTDVPQFTASGGSRVDTTLVLDAIENPTASNPRGVHINLPATVLKDTTYGTGFIDRIWVECRDPLAFSPYFEGPFQSPVAPDQPYAANLAGGVVLHLSEAAHPENGTWRLDGDAGAVAGLPDFDMLDSVLKPGQQRSLGSSNLWIQCLAWNAGASQATIRLWYDPAGIPPPSISSPTSTKTCLVMPFSWTGTTINGTGTTWGQTLTHANTFFSDVSYGQFQFTFTLTPKLSIPTPPAPNDQAAVSTAVLSAASAAGYTPADYDVILYFCPVGAGFVSGVSGSTFANLPPAGGVHNNGPVTFIADQYHSYGNSFVPGVVCHELCHALYALMPNGAPGNYANRFGTNLYATLPHSSSMMMPTGVKFAPASLTFSNQVEYGNMFDTMGAGGQARGHLSARQKNALGWMAGRIQTVSASGSFTLAPLESSAAATQALVVSDGAYTFWLEYRTSSNQDSFIDGSTIKGGVFVYVIAPPNLGNVHEATALLLDMTPADQANPADLDPGLVVGDSFTTPSGVVIKTTAAGANATVQVTLVPTGVVDPVFTVGIADGARTNSTTETFTWAPATGATWWTQLDNDAWVNRGSATTLTLSNLHGATRHRFRVMSVTNGVASRIAHREWDVVGPYSRVKFSTGTESCLVIPVQYGGNPPFVGTAPNTNPDVIKALFIPCDRVTNKLDGVAADWQVHLDQCAALHRQASWNQITIQWTQAPKLTIPDPAVANTFDQALDRYHIIQALTARGVDYTGYDMLCYVCTDPFPSDAGGPSEIFVEDLSVGPHSTAFSLTHEVGHALGMSHDGSITTFPYSGKATVDAQPQPPSVVSEYGSPYSVMGGYGYQNGATQPYFAVAQPSMFNKWLAGWCRGSQIQQVSAGGTYQLNGRENVNPTLPQALVMASSEGVEYWVEFVKPGTTQQTDSELKTLNPAVPQPSVLIYARTPYQGLPYTTAGLYDQHTYLVYPDLLVQAKATGFVQGDTFTDHGLKITVGAITSTTATVTIANPVAPSMLPLQSMARPGQIHDLAMSGDSTKAVLTWTNPPAAADQIVVIWRDGRFKSFVNPGVTTYTDTTVAGVAHDYWVVAQHAQAAGVSGHIQSAPSNMVTWTPSFTGPRSPTGTPADWQSQLDTINAYYQENSWGQFSFNFTLAPIVSVPAPTPTVATTDPAYFNQVYPPMMTAADAAALAAGYDRSQYQHVYYMPPDIGDNMIGADFVVQNPTLTQPLVCLVPNGLDPTYIYGLNASTHEFGHSLGFSHANALDAGTVTLSPTALTSAEANPTGAANVEYGNPTSTMGRGQPV